MHVKYGEAVAILTTSHLLTMSTKLLTWAYRELKPYGLGHPENLVVLMDNLSTYMGFEGASGGQMMDLKRVSMKEPGAIQKMMTRKTSSFFQIAVQSAVLVCSSEEVDEQTIDQLIAISDAIGLAFQTFDDFEDILEDEDKGSNCVTVNGTVASYEQFNRYTEQCVRTLKELGMYNVVFEDVIYMMRVSIEKRMKASETQKSKWKDVLEVRLTPHLHHQAGTTINVDCESNQQQVDFRSPRALNIVRLPLDHLTCKFHIQKMEWLSSCKCYKVHIAFESHEALEAFCLERVPLMCSDIASDTWLAGDIFVLPEQELRLDVLSMKVLRK